MATRRPTEIKLNRLEARIRLIRGLNRIAFMAMCLSVGFLVVATAFPQRRNLEKLETKLALAQIREQDILAEKEYHTIEHQALREDPKFLELHARDRLDYYTPGEKILKIQREP